MIEFLPAMIIFLVECVLLVLWFRSRKEHSGRARWYCFWGFLLGQLYLMWEVSYVKQTGQPVPGSAEQKALMGRLILGGFIGGVFTIIGLFYLSFGVFKKHE